MNNSWYTQAMAAAKDVANLSWQTPIGFGNEDLYRIRYNGSLTEEKTEVKVPGIMKLNYVPILLNGPASMSDAVNVAAEQLYAWIRKANSGARNYDPADVMMYILAMTPLFEIHAFIRRIYGLISAGSTENKYYSEAILSSMGVNPTEVRRRAPEIRAFLNVYARRLNTLNVPGVFPIFARRVWMTSHIFTDGETQKSQLYYFSPSYLHKYDATAGRLLTVPFDTEIDYDGPLVKQVGTQEVSTKFFVDQLLDLADELLTNALAIEDLAIISGDIAKAYGSDFMWKVEDVAEDYKTEILYSPEVLTQIKCATVTGPLLQQSLDIYQKLLNTGTAQKFLINQGVDSSLYALSGNHSYSRPFVLRETEYDLTQNPTVFLYSDAAKHDYQWNFGASRLCASLGNTIYHATITNGPSAGADTPYNREFYYQELYTSGTEVIEYVRIYTFGFTSHAQSATPKLLVTQLWDLCTLGSTQSGSVDARYEASGFLEQQVSAFKEHPRLRISDNNAKIIIDCLEIQNFCPVAQNVLANINEVALLSLMGIGTVGKMMKFK